LILLDKQPKMQIAIAQITTDPGKTDSNTKKIIAAIERARAQKCSVIVFPELALSGYGSMDLFHRVDFINENAAALEMIRQNSQNIAVIVGFPELADHSKRAGARPLLYNSAALIHDQKVIGIQAKQLLPNYEIFSEERYFVPGKSSQIFNLLGRKIGIQICEDLWDAEYENKVSRSLITQGAEIIFNLSASPFEPGKFAARSERIAALYSERNFKGHFVYANLVGSFDGFEGEVVFDGRSTVHDASGNLVALGKSFGEDFIVFDLGGENAKGVSPAPALTVDIDPVEETYQALVLGVREFFRRLSMKKAFIGLSGGIDSAVVAALAVEALGKENVVGVTMPSKITSAETKDDALLLAKNLGIRCDVRPIAEELDAWKKSFVAAMGREPQGLTVQNKQARIRGAIMMEYSNEVPGGLVLTTGNKTELATGYCTLYGDMCGALAVIGDVSKLRVYEVAGFVNLRAGTEVIPGSTIERVPTAELAEGQEDRQSLPADYPILSPLVERIVEELDTLTGLNESFEPSVTERVIGLVNRNEFKRRQAAPGIRVSSHAFGVGRRLPMGI
jgi:NAD+ synthase (glutamine-hydrolysing)